MLRVQTDAEDFMESAGIGMLVLGSDGTVLRANQPQLDLLGYPAGEVVGRAFAGFHVDPGIADRIVAALERGEKLTKVPAQLRAQDGAIKDVLVTSGGPSLESGVAGTRCFIIDVTAAERPAGLWSGDDQNFRALLEALPVAIYTTDAEGRITFYNEAAVALAGRRPELGTDQWCVSWRLYNPDGTPLAHSACPMAIALRDGIRVRGVEAVLERPDGTRAPFLPYPTPLFDRSGKLVGAVNLLMDLTDRYQAGVDSERLAAIVESSDDAIISKTLEGIVTSWNAGARRIFGYDAAEMIGEPIRRIVPIELGDEEARILAQLRRGERIDHYETVRIAKDGHRINISLTVSPLRDRLGNVVGASKIARDVSERKRAEETQRLLIHELDHRLKNTLSTIQAMAQQTLRRAKSPADFVTSFAGRLQALARAHTLLTESKWEGADFSNLVHDQLLLAGSDTRVAYSGPAVILEPQLALHLALVLHELGTNARKYGALSVPEGRLALSWSVKTEADRELHIQWVETNGPKIAMPAAPGFGSALISQIVRPEGGSARMRSEARGISWEIIVKLPEADLRGPNSEPNREGAWKRGIMGEVVVAGAASLVGRRVLVVEDEPLIALEISATLSDAGINVIGPARTIDEATRLIASERLDAALLDVNLAGQPVDQISSALGSRGVPFAFVTGYGRDNLPPAFRTVPLVRKPFMPEQVVATIAELLAKGDAQVIKLRR